MKNKNNSVEMNANTFGKLVQAYRKQRGWTQEQLASEWGYTREYVSQVESGKRKLDRDEQVMKLAKILNIPIERLEAVGKGIPKEKTTSNNIEAADDILLQTLLEPAETTVKLSWLVWYGNNDTTIIDNLTHLIEKLEYAIENRRGKLLKPAQQLLAYAHEMMGKIEFDKLHFPEASTHFDEMILLGEEVNNSDLIALGMTHKADIYRRRGRLDTAVKCLEVTEKFANAGSIATSGLRWQTLARTYAEQGNKNGFERAIEEALKAVNNLTPSIDTTSNELTKLHVIQEKAQGYVLLWEPFRAIKIYEDIDRANPFRPVRDQGEYAILKAQAFGYNGELEEGIKYALEGLKLAKSYHSTRHISRVQRMNDRLKVTKLGKAPQMKSLQLALDAISH